MLPQARHPWGGLSVAGLVVANWLAVAGAGECRVAATGNGQMVCRLDAERRMIVGHDIDHPEPGRDLVGPAGPAGPEFIAVGCLPGDIVATVCRTGDEWSLRTYRVRPDGPVDAAAPLQDIAIGRASGPAATVDLAVSHARGWLAVTGLPAPLPPVLRAAVAGVRVGPLSDRSCPAPAGGVRIVAAAVSPDDELVLALRPDPSAAEPADDALAFFDSAGHELLRLDAGIRGTVGIDFSRGDGTLWAAAADAPDSTGLWRLDAALEAGRQVVRARLVSVLDEPADVACPSTRTIVVAHGDGGRTVAWIDAAALPPGVRP